MELIKRKVFDFSSESDIDKFFLEKGFSVLTQAIDPMWIDSIIDKGGEDTLNFSALNQSAYINLSPNTWSSLQFTGNESQFLSEENWVYEKGDLYISDHTEIENVFGTNLRVVRIIKINNEEFGMIRVHNNLSNIHITRLYILYDSKRGI